MTHAPLRCSLAALAFAFAFALPAAGEAQVGNGRGPINTDAAGVALKGFDPVAYQAASQAVPGLDTLTAMHDGVTYRFASAANRGLFVKDPARYAPAYGGYCAMGVVGGRKVDVDPMAFTVVDGRLYMNKNLRTRTIWTRDIPGFIVRADSSWPRALRQIGF